MLKIQFFILITQLFINNQDFKNFEKLLTMLKTIFFNIGC